MIDEFKKFILRGNVIDLSVAVIIGLAFKAVIDGLVGFIIMPIIGIIGGKPSFDQYFLTINDSKIRWGSFLTVLVSFLIVAAALFAVVKSFEKLQQLRKETVVDEPEQELTASEQLLGEIRDLLRAQGGATPPV
jgi:large conductance mechanosensitive channel